MLYNSSLMGISDSIKEKAVELGFCAVGITTAEPIDAEQIRYFSRWLESGRAGQMQYMHRNLEKRTNPAKLLKGAKSVVCVAINYKPLNCDNCSTESGANGRIANYALYEDYHRFIKKRLYKLVDFITSLTADSLRFKVCVDSAPIAERALAQRAGLGFVGKNHMLINPWFGPQILLAELLTNLKLPPDKPAENKCGDCNECIKSCQTGALTEDGGFDANKCISYLTIEYEGPISPQTGRNFGNRLFGCDDCVIACPYEKAAPVCKNNDFKFYGERRWIDVKEVAGWDEPGFERRFAGSPVARCGLERLKRNAQICLDNITGG